MEGILLVVHSQDTALWTASLLSMVRDYSVSIKLEGRAGHDGVVENDNR